MKQDIADRLEILEGQRAEAKQLRKHARRAHRNDEAESLTAFINFTNQYMIPGDNGRIIPNRDIGGGGGITLNVTNNIQANNGWTEQDSKALQQTIENTAMRLMQRESTRPGGMLQGRRR